MKNQPEKIDVKQFAAYLAPRPRDCHKGDCGHVLVIGGDAGYSGAVRLAAEAALRVGAGLVSVATRRENAFSLNAMRPEIMCHAVDSASALKPLLEKATTVIVGPGLGKTSWASELLNAAMECQKPLVVDADGLNLLANIKMQKDYWVLTPHPGEAAGLLGVTVEEVQQDRLSAVIKLQKMRGGIVVLKGAGSLIVDQAGLPVLCGAGNPGMATAGMGDVLTGVIAGLIAQRIPTSIATKLAVCLHAEAGDLAAVNGERGMIASDLFVPLRTLVNP